MAKPDRNLSILSFKKLETVFVYVRLRELKNFQYLYDKRKKSVDVQI